MSLPLQHDKRDVLRTFLALELPFETKRALADYVAPLRTVEPGVSWTKAENFHLTLKFLGDTTPAQAASLAQAVPRVCANFAPITVAISGFGVFPNERRPRVLWLGLQEDTGKLHELAQQLELACRTLGFAKAEQAFTAHLTLGRVKSGNAAAALRMLRASPFAAQHFAFRECTHMQSVLHRAGSIYTPLHRFPLGAAL